MTLADTHLQTNAMQARDALAGGKVLVTGATGFIGAHLCRRLQAIGMEVSAISRTPRSSDTSDLQWWQGDLSDITTVRGQLHAIKPEIIFHLASHVAGARGLELVLPTFHSNLISTVNLLTAATEIGCRRMIIVGSLEEPAPGDAETIPCSPYAAAKWASSTYARMFYALYQTPVVIARLFMVYGPDQPDRHKLIPYAIDMLLRGQAPRLSSGQRLIDWIYIDDVVDGLLAAALAPNVEGQTVDLGSGALIPIHEVVRQLVTLVGARVAPVFGALPDRMMEQVRAADTTAAYAVLGWRPSTPLEQGLRKTVEWYRTQLVAAMAMAGATTD
jgi:UDP-glucose 4-epimerase